MKDSKEACQCDSVFSGLVNLGEVQLTEHQYRVVELLKSGHSSAAIAKHLGVSQRAVQMTLRRIYSRFQIGSTITDLDPELLVIQAAVMSEKANK